MTSTGTLQDLRTATPARPRTQRPRAYTPAPGNAPRPRPHGKLGSRQQVSVRGRRVARRKDTNLPLTRRIVAAVVFLIAGIMAVMYLSGLTTQQTFELSEAKQRSLTLSNELESLERDVANAQSAGHIAAEATRLGMVAPAQPGVLEDRGAEVVEVRPSDPQADRPVTDVNGEARPRGATSDPEKTNRVEGLAPNEAVAAGDVAPNSTELPYSDRLTAATPVAPPAP